MVPDVVGWRERGAVNVDGVDLVGDDADDLDWPITVLEGSVGEPGRGQAVADTSFGGVIEQGDGEQTLGESTPCSLASATGSSVTATPSSLKTGCVVVLPAALI